MKSEVQRSRSETMGAPRYCRDCGALMKEVWRTVESLGAYVWHECSRPECDGAYLLHLYPQAKARRSAI